MFTAPSADSGPLVDAGRNAEARPPRCPGSRSSGDRLDERVQQLLLRRRRASAAREARRPCPVSSRTPARIFVPPRSTPMHSPARPPAGTLLPRMAPKDKPYRVYRGGRVKGKVPAVPVEDAPCAVASRSPRRTRAQRFGWLRPDLVEAGRPDRRCSALVVLAIAWGVAGYLSFSSGVSDANKRFDRERGAKARSRRATASCSATARRSCCSGPTARPSPAGAATGTPTRSCSCAPTRRTTSSRTSRSRATCSCTSTGVGNAKINAAYQAGGAALAIRTVQRLHRCPDRPRRDRRLQPASRT